MVGAVPAQCQRWRHNCQDSSCCNLVTQLTLTPTDNSSSFIAPSHMPPPKGKATSPTQIRLRWIAPTHPNGILQPYRVTCYSTKSGGAPIHRLTKSNTTTVVKLGRLQPNTPYRCRVEASTYPAKDQDPKECITESGFSDTIKTKPAGASDLCYHFPSY